MPPFIAVPAITFVRQLHPSARVVCIVPPLIVVPPIALLERRPPCTTGGMIRIVQPLIAVPAIPLIMSMVGGIRTRGGRRAGGRMVGVQHRRSARFDDDTATRGLSCAAKTILLQQAKLFTTSSNASKPYMILKGLNESFTPSIGLMVLRARGLEIFSRTHTKDQDLKKDRPLAWHRSLP